MLELKTYQKAELSALFGTRNTQGLERKMERYGINFEKSGRGNRATYTITAIKDPFKIFCITELDFDGGTDFHKVRNFYYYYFNDEEFMAMPDEVKEYRMKKEGNPVTRQTIATYISKLDAKGLINRNTTNFVYYFANRQTQRRAERAEYNQAWREYWESVNSGSPSSDAIWDMRVNYGGVARKQAIPDINGIYNDKIEYMMGLIVQSIENEMGD